MLPDSFVPAPLSIQVAQNFMNEICPALTAPIHNYNRRNCFNPGQMFVYAEFVVISNGYTILKDKLSSMMVIKLKQSFKGSNYHISTPLFAL